MTERTFPSGVRESEPDKLARVWRRSGGDWVVPADEVLLADREGFAGTPLDAFAAAHSASSMDVIIGSGEGVVVGVWVGKDTQTTLTLAPQTDNQTVYLGWSASAENSVLVGLDGAFSSAEPADQRIPVWEFDTNGSGVTAARDLRPLGEQINVRNEGSVAQADQATSATTATNLDGGTAEWKVQHGVILNGDHSDFSTAQDAINYAENNDMARVVFPGLFYGAITVETPGLEVVGVGPATVFISDSDVPVRLRGKRNVLRNAAAACDDTSRDRNVIAMRGEQCTVTNCFIEGETDGTGVAVGQSGILFGCHFGTNNFSYEFRMTEDDGIAMMNTGVLFADDSGSGNAISHNTPLNP